ncbi:MAG: hydrogenase maturation protease [Chloroflexi bacterium]|nr:hydrogenase maturation protease [Chloroflexota bacterium]
MIEQDSAQQRPTAQPSASQAMKHGRMLLIAYGNLSRRDDGVAFHVLRRLRQQLVANSGPSDADKEELIAGRVTAMRMHQLTPELAELLAEYAAVIFIDAHVQGAGWAPVHWEEISPGLRPSMVSHHLKPSSLLALCQMLYGRCPKGYILSVEGSDFDFGEHLSPTTSALADQAVQRLIDFIRSESLETKD